MSVVSEVGRVWLAWLPFAVVATGVVVLGALAVDRLLRRRISPRWLVAVYALVFVRLALPVARWWNGQRDITELDTTLFAAADGLAVVTRPLGANAPAPVGPQASVDWATLAGALYLSVATLLVLRLVRGALRLRRLRRESRAHSNHGRVEVLLHDAAGPLACHPLRPAVIVPQSMLSLPAPVFRLVLRHELAHHRHGDLVVVSLLRWATALLWPVAPLWLAAARIRHHMELAADAWAIGETTTSKERRSFARTLTDYATGPAVAGAGLSQFANLSARVEAIARPPSRRGRTLAGAAAAMVAGACAAVPVEPADDASFNVDQGAATDADDSEAPNAEALSANRDDPAHAEELFACANDNLARFNEASDKEDADPTAVAQFLANSAGCYAEAGIYGRAAILVKELDSAYPEFEHDLDFEQLKGRSRELWARSDAAATTIWGRYCAAQAGEPRLADVESATLLELAQCYRDGTMGAAALEVMQALATREDLSAEQRDDNAAMLGRAKTHVERARAEGYGGDAP